MWVTSRSMCELKSSEKKFAVNSCNLFSLLSSFKFHTAIWVSRYSYWLYESIRKWSAKSRFGHSGKSHRMKKIHRIISRRIKKSKKRICELKNFQFYVVLRFFWFCLGERGNGVTLHSCHRWILTLRQWLQIFCEFFLED